MEGQLWVRLRVDPRPTWGIHHNRALHVSLRSHPSCLISRSSSSHRDPHGRYFSFAKRSFSALPELQEKDRNESRDDKVSHAKEHANSPIAFKHVGPRKAVVPPPPGDESRPFTTRLYEKLNLQYFTRQEFGEAFDRMDIDKNGQLDAMEVTTFLGPELSAELMNKLLKDANYDGKKLTIEREAFINGLDLMARKVDSRVWSIAVSMLLTGTAVGVVVPVLPMFVRESLSGTSTHFGLVIGAFALSKMLGNVPSAVIADGFGRKPVLGVGMGLIALGTGMIAFSDSFSHLLFARFVTGAGVAAFTTASTLYLADVSTPLNRATSMAPIVAAFSAGTTIGPAMGGFLADQIGVNACFALTGACFTGLTVYNHLALSETHPKRLRSDRHMAAAAKDAFRSWGPIFRNDNLRSIFVVNGAYWVAMSGAQTTLLPLMLAEAGYSAGDIGMVFACLSTVFVVGSQPAGWLADRYGRFPCIVGACGVVSLGIGLFPFGFYSALGLWAVGGTLLGVSPTAFVADLAPTRSRSQALAVLRTVGDVGLLLGAAGTGIVADLFGFKAAMLSNAALLGTTTAWFAWTSRTRK